MDVAMVTSLSDDGGEDIELRDLGHELSNVGGEDVELQDLGDEEALDPSLSIEEEPPAEDNLQTVDLTISCL